MFSDIAYLDWIEGRPEAAEYDLGSSDLRRAPAGPDEVVPPALADVPSPERSVTTQLADAYGVAPENVLLTAGATHANFLAVAAALSEAEPGADDDDGNDGGIDGGVIDSGTGGGTEAELGTAARGDGASSVRVLVEKPGYEPLAATPSGLGATVDRFRRPKEEGYPLDTGRVSGALVEDTAMVTVTNRHNPSGRRVGRDELAETAQVVADGGARLLVDEVYAPFAVEAESADSPDDSDAPAPFDGPTAAGLANAVVTSSLTKFFGFGGLRLGWLVADAAFVARARSVSHHVPAVAEPSRLLARRVLARAGALAADSRKRVRANHEALAEFVAERVDISGRVAPGCTYAFLEHESADGTEVAAAAGEQGVLVVPGRFFDDADRFRIAACQNPATVRPSLDRFGDVLDALGE